jgi:hypothetical protein
MARAHLCAIHAREGRRRTWACKLERCLGSKKISVQKAATITARSPEWRPADPWLSGGAMVGSIFSSDAWNNVTFIAGEKKRPNGISGSVAFYRYTGRYRCCMLHEFSCICTSFLMHDISSLTKDDSALAQLWRLALRPCLGDPAVAQVHSDPGKMQSAHSACPITELA